MISIAPIGKAEGKLACVEETRASRSPFVRAEGRKKGINMNNYNQHFSFRIPFYIYNNFLSYRN